MLVAQLFPAATGGAERQCWRQARALAKRGHEVAIATKWLDPRSARSEIVEGVRIWRRGCFFSVRRALSRRRNDARPEVREPGAAAPAPTPRSAWLGKARNALFIAELAWFAKSRRFQADVIHVHESHWIAGVAQWLGAKTGIPVWCKEAFQPVLLYGGAEEIPWAATWRQRRLACNFLAITEAIADDLAAAGIPRARIVPIPNGVEIPAEAAESGKHADAVYIGNFTQGAAHKGFDVLLEAWGLALRQEPGMRLRLYGRGDPAPWRRLAEQCGAGISTTFAGEVADIAAVHRTAGFLVLPSRREGLSNALLEALASGLPAVVSDIPGNVAAVRDGVEGLVVPAGDATALAEAMLRMYRQPEMRARMGAAARARAGACFSMESVAQRLETAYAEAVSAERG